MLVGEQYLDTDAGGRLVHRHATGGVAMREIGREPSLCLDWHSARPGVLFRVCLLIRLDWTCLVRCARRSIGT